MTCPNCKQDQDKVFDSRPYTDEAGNDYVYRRRKCLVASSGSPPMRALNRQALAGELLKLLADVDVLRERLQRLVNANAPEAWKAA